jgi:DNA polymerase III subunit epsilon
MPLAGLMILTLVLALFWYASKVLFAKPPAPIEERPKLAGLTEKQAKDKARRVARKESAIDQALTMTDVPYIVADIETTGLSSRDHDILEMAAALVSPQGRILAEFSTLVRTGQRVPSEITQLTGITTRDLEAHGKSLGTALKSYLGFIGNHPVFFHKASFDKGFIQEAIRRTQPVGTAQKNGYTFEAGVYDSLPIVRNAWPHLPNHKLASLARMVGALEASHRALADVRALVAVMSAAKHQIRLNRKRQVAPEAQVPSMGAAVGISR